MTGMLGTVDSAYCHLERDEEETEDTEDLGEMQYIRAI